VHLDEPPTSKTPSHTPTQPTTTDHHPTHPSPPHLLSFYKTNSTSFDDRKNPRQKKTLFVMDFSAIVSPIDTPNKQGRKPVFFDLPSML
jgi:hypothetical protein